MIPGRSSHRGCGPTGRLTGPAAARHFEHRETRVARPPHCPKESHVSSCIRWLAPTTTAHAHCDIPCGIYDPHERAARRPHRRPDGRAHQRPRGRRHRDRNKFTRCVRVKEQHAEQVKREVQVIWSDYFKPEHLGPIPDLHDKVWKILKLAGKNKQSVDADAAAQLEAAVKEFGEIFWATKK